MAALDEWRWTDDQGVQRVVRTDELRSALASSVLSPSTLVWREGMVDWVPAFTVPELGASDGANLSADGPADAPAPLHIPGAPLPGLPADAASDASIPRPVEPPALVRTSKKAPRPDIGSIADTGRATPTEILNDIGTPAATAGRPRPAAGQEPANAGLKIAAAPRLGAAPVPRQVAGKLESPSKVGVPRAGGSPWRKPEGAKAKVDEDVTMVAEGRVELFKAKPSEGAARAGEGPARATPSPANASPASAAKNPGRVAASLASRRPVTHTAMLDGKEPSKPSFAASRAPSTVPPPGPATGAARSPSTPAPAPRPAAGRSPSTVPPPGAGTASTSADKGNRSTAVRGSPSGAAPAAAGAPGVSVPSAPRLPVIARPAYPIAEHSSTDSTGVLPLSGAYSAEPKAPSPQDAQAPRPGQLQAPAQQPRARDAAPSYVEGAPAFAARTPSFHEAAVATPAEPMLLGAAASEPVRVPMRSHPPQAFSTMPASAFASYPPAPDPMMGPNAPGFGAPRGTLRSQSLVQSAGYTPLPNLPMTHTPPPQGYAAMPGPSQPGAYGAPPAPLLAGEPAPGELRATGAMPLVNPKRTHAADAASGDADAMPQGAGKLGDPVIVPMSSLFGAGGILIAMAIGAFFMGRCSAGPGPSAPPARAALAALPRLAHASLPSLPKPCWMAKQPVRWAPSVLQTVPVDVAPTANGVVVAYARDAHEPATVEVDFASGTFTDKPEAKRDGDLVRVLAPRDGTSLLTTTKSDTGALVPYVFAPGAAPFVIGVSGRGTPSPAVAAADKPEGTPETLWTLSQAEDDKGLDAARVVATGPSSHAVVFRRTGKILGGFVGEGRKPVGALEAVAGSGGSPGKPSLGTNQREVAVVFADKATNESPWEIRVGRAALGQMPRETIVVPLPKGGPGGDAFLPDVAGIADGRWVLVWTEGTSGAYAVRAQTFGPDFKPLGDPIAISPPAGNFGQAVVGVAGNYVTTMFLSKASSGGYELWGAVLQCGS